MYVIKGLIISQSYKKRLNRPFRILCYNSVRTSVNPPPQRYLIFLQQILVHILIFLSIMVNVCVFSRYFISICLVGDSTKNRITHYMLITLIMFKKFLLYTRDLKEKWNCTCLLLQPHFILCIQCDKMRYRNERKTHSTNRPNFNEFGFRYS